MYNTKVEGVGRRWSSVVRRLQPSGTSAAATSLPDQNPRRGTEDAQDKTGRRTEPAVPAEEKELSVAIKIRCITHQVQTLQANQTPVTGD